MKKLIALLLALSFIVLSFSGCEKPVTDNSSSENLNSYKEALQNDTFGENSHGFSVKENPEAFSAVDVFRSAKQLQAFCLRYSEDIEEKRQDEFVNLCNSYKEEYFENKILVVAIVRLHSDYKKVTNVGLSESKELVVNISTDAKRDYDQRLSDLFVIECEKGVDIKSKFDVKLFVDGEERRYKVLSYDGTLVNDTYGINSVSYSTHNSSKDTYIIRNYKECNKVTTKYLEKIELASTMDVTVAKKHFERYTKEFFKEKTLIVFEQYCPSGSDDVIVTNAGLSKDGKLVINTHRIEKEISIDDPGTVVNFVEVEANVKIKSFSDVDIYVDSEKKEDFYGGMIVTFIEE